MRRKDYVLAGGVAILVPLIMIVGAALLVMRLPIDAQLQVAVAVWIAIPFSNSINVSRVELRKWSGSLGEYMKALAMTLVLASLAAAMVAGAILIFPSTTRIGGIVTTGMALLIFGVVLLIGRRRKQSEG